MNRIDWYYIYSERYYPFHFYLQEKIPSFFQARGIFIPQTVFDEHLYKHEGEHFFSRITIKIETVLKIIDEKIEADDRLPFMFTDCDILVRNQANIDIFAYTKSETTDMFFQKEFKNQENMMANPGAMMIWPNERTKQFWLSVLSDMKANPTSMEMQSINKILSESNINIKWDFFSITHVFSSITATLETLGKFSIYHILCSGKSREIDIGDKMFEATTIGENMDKYVRMTIEKYGRVFM